MENTENHFKTRGRSEIILASIRPLFAWLLQHFLPYISVVFATLKTLICSQYVLRESARATGIWETAPLLKDIAPKSMEKFMAKVGYTNFYLQLLLNMMNVQRTQLASNRCTSASFRFLAYPHFFFQLAISLSSKHNYNTRLQHQNQPSTVRN